MPLNAQIFPLDNSRLAMAVPQHRCFCGYTQSVVIHLYETEQNGINSEIAERQWIGGRVGKMTDICRY